MNEPHKQKFVGGWVRTILGYGAVAALFLFYANFETSRSEYDADYELVKIERFNASVVSMIGWGSLVAAMSLLTVTFVSFKRGWLRWPALGFLLVFVIYPYAVISHTLQNLAPWTVHGQVETHDGSRYVFCDMSFLQGQAMAIAEITGVGPLKTSYRVLVDNNGDSPRSWASLVRPDASLDKYGQLYFCNNFLVGVRYDNRCYLAYDLKNKHAFGYGKIEKLSPFICLDDADKPSAIDIERTCDQITKHVEFCVTTEDPSHAQAFLNGDTTPGCPPLAAIRAGLAQDSAHLSSAAKMLLACYHESFTKIRSRLSESKSRSDNARKQNDEHETAEPGDFGVVGQLLPLGYRERYLAYENSPNFASYAFRHCRVFRDCFGSLPHRVSADNRRVQIRRILP